MQLKGNLFLLLAAFIWGTAFVAQLVGMDDLGPFTYCSGRYILGFFAVVIVWFAMRGAREKKKAAGEYFPGWKYGICAGLIMFGGTTTQQISMLYTTAGKAAFLTCLYIIFVPLFSVLLKKKIRKENWIGAFLGMAGLYFLCIKDDLSWNIGDMYAFIGAIFWSFHILFIDRYADRADNIEISIGQISVCAVLSTILAFTFFINAQCLVSYFLCRRNELWCGIYTSDSRSALCRTISCGSYYEPGIRIWCAFGVAYSRGADDWSGDFRLLPHDVWYADYSV